MPSSDLLGYADKLSVAPGERVAFMVSTPLDRFRAQIVRLTKGPAKAGALPEGSDVLIEDSFAGRHQSIPIGSYVLVPNAESVRIEDELTIQSWIYPTMASRERDQAIVAKWDQTSQAGFALLIDGTGRLAFEVGDGTGNVSRVTAPDAVHERRWLFVAVTVDTETIHLFWHELPRGWITAEPGEASLSDPARLKVAGDSPLLIGAHNLHTDELGNSCPTGSLNGKVDRLRLWGTVLSRTDLDSLREGLASSVADGALIGRCARWEKRGA